MLIFFLKRRLGVPSTGATPASGAGTSWFDAGLARMRAAGGEARALLRARPAPRGGVAPSGVSERSAAPETGTLDVPRYPPCDPGLPVVPVSAVLASQAGLVARLRRAVAAEGEVFDERYMSVVARLAAQVHLLPASACAHFAGAGGLFRYCLEMGLFARQAAEGRIFAPEASSQARRALEPRWRYACFLAGLLSPLPRAMAGLIVTDPNGLEWDVRSGSLVDWLASVEASRYHAGWHADADADVERQASASSSAAHWQAIAPADLARWLDDAQPGLFNLVLDAASGRSPPRDSALAELVAATRARVLAHDEANRRTRYGRLRIGHQLELHVVDAIRHRIESGQWRTSSREGPLWHRDPALFLEWPVAADAIRHDIARSGVRGVPLAAATLAEVLGRAEFIVPAPDGGWLWRIEPLPGTHGGVARHRAALRFAAPGALLASCSESVSMPSCTSMDAAVAPPAGEIGASQGAVRATTAGCAGAPGRTLAGRDRSDGGAGAGANAEANAKAHVDADAAAAANPDADADAGAEAEVDADRQVDVNAEAGAAAKGVPNVDKDRRDMRCVGDARSGADVRVRVGEPEPDAPRQHRPSAPDRAPGEASRSPRAARPPAGPVPRSDAPALPSAIDRLVERCGAELANGSGQWVCRLQEGGLGVSAAFLVASGFDVPLLAGELERRDWLGRVQGARGSAPLGRLSMAGGPTLGLVLNPHAVRLLGLQSA